MRPGAALDPSGGMAEVDHVTVADDVVLSLDAQQSPVSGVREGTGDMHGVRKNAKKKP